MTCHSTAIVPAPSEKEDNKRGKRKKKKGKGSVLKSRENLLNKNRTRFSKILSRCNCGVLNLKWHTNCSGCSALIRKEEHIANNVVYLDLERCEGNLMSTPISVGLAKIGMDKILEKEIFVIPEKDTPWKLPSRNSYLCREITSLYYKGSKMYKKGVCKGEDKLLPAVSEKEALDQFLGFCQEHDTDAIVYHGEDHRTLKPWLQRFGICTNVHDSGTPSPIGDFRTFCSCGMILNPFRLFCLIDTLHLIPCDMTFHR